MVHETTLFLKFSLPDLYWILVPQPGIKPKCPALEARSPNDWTEPNQLTDKQAKTESLFLATISRIWEVCEALQRL